MKAFGTAASHANERQRESGEPKNAPELPIGRFLKSKSLGGNRVIFIDYEVLGLQVAGATVF